jgi:hypothetical protein
MSHLDYPLRPLVGVKPSLESPDGLHASSRNLPHPSSVHKTYNMSHHRKRLNSLKSGPVASLRNLQNRHLDYESQFGP